MRSPGTAHRLLQRYIPDGRRSQCAVRKWYIVYWVCIVPHKRAREPYSKAA